MSIRALPADTCRLLGSSTLLPTPVSLVKELVDNAVDAGASSIEVLMSPNTVDKIEVRDDGRGILPADFDALGRRGHTSKLTQLADLAKAGGASLGFRGEGLASANTLGYVAVTTRTVGDPVAMTFRLALGLGGVSTGSLKPASAPPGTTVTVTCLFSALPVRRKRAVQKAAKTVAAIKALLTGYALARPQLRLTFRVFQQPAPVWHYHPRPTAASAAASSSSTPPSSNEGDGSGTKEAVLALFGNEAARQCQEVVVSAVELLAGQSTQSQTMFSGIHSETDGSGFIFETYLPRSNADLSRLAVGGFVSVDGRPLSAHHPNGIAKKLLTIFRAHLGKSILHGIQQQQKTRDAFMRLNMKCPAGSYDPNVEPSKTDVLFADEKFMLDAFERLCVRVYGQAAQERAHLHTLPSSASYQQQPLPLVQQSSTHNRQLLVEESDFERRLRREAPQAAVNNAQRRTQVARAFSSRVPAVSYSSSPYGQTTRPRPRAATKRRARSLQTLPSSSPPEGYYNRRTHRRGDDSPVEADLPGLISNDGFRQTTISFGVCRQHQQHPAHKEQMEAASSNALVVTGNMNRPRQTFVAASDLYRQEQQPSHTDLLSSSGHAQGNVTRPFVPQTPPAGERAIPVQPIHQLPGHLQRTAQGVTEKPVYTMEVDIDKLKRDYARFTSRGIDRKGKLDYLSPDMADISNIKKRLRETLINWIAKTKPAGGMAVEEPLEVKFYLRQSLKEKALVVRKLEA